MGEPNSKNAVDILNKLMNQQFFPPYAGRYGAVAYGTDKQKHHPKKTTASYKTSRAK
ncbi:hypothetical protein [Butyrivibrio sp. NC3005]|uniref:hypothetical protein n=1 Tax=Butyrivibrio sp. NC3005 TaxID=1280685 RepID=UPI0003F5D82D|nr:hypothetical protein [Butyrivibrio sp. NC3005]